MSQTAKRLRLIFESTFILKLITVVAFFFLIFPTLKSVVDGLVKIVLVWGGAQLVYDAFIRRTFLKGRYAFWLLMFLLMEAVTVVLNIQSGFKNNVSMMGYTAVAMLVLYPNGEDREPMDLLREMRILGFVMIGLCAVASAVSLVIFVLDYSGTLVYANTLYYTGVFEGRLWGIYSNPDFPAAIIASMLSLVQLPLCHAVTKNRKMLGLQYTAALLCFVLNFWYAVLAQSRGSLYAFAGFMFVYLFFQLRKKVFASLRSFAVSFILSAAVAALGTAAVWYSEPVILRLSSDLPAYTQTQDTSSDSSAVKQAQKAKIGRDVVKEQNNVLTNRSLIWKMGLEKFVKKPLFGYGNSGSTHGVIVNEKEVKHFHNFFVHSLVANGLAGTIPLAIFVLLSLFAMVRYCVKHRNCSFKTLQNPEVPEIIYSLIALIAFYMANNMVEVFIVYTVSLPNFLFWIYLGYLMSLMTRGQPISRTDRLIRHLGASGPSGAEEKTV